VYDGNKVRNPNEDTTDIYIIPLKDGWWIVDATITMNENKHGWVKAVEEGKSTPIAGPFKQLDDAKAAWRVIYG